MATIKVNCGINNPKCSPSRIFSIESLNFDERISIISEAEADLKTDANLMYIIGQCEAIISDYLYSIADIVVVDNTAFHRILSITKRVKNIEGFKPFKMPFDFVRTFNNYLYKTEYERAFTASQWSNVVATANKTMLLAKEMLSNIFSDGISTVYNYDNNKLCVVPTKSVIELLGVDTSELNYGIALHCENKEITIVKQEYENLLLELELFSEEGHDDSDTDIEFFSSAIGILAAFMQ